MKIIVCDDEMEFVKMIARYCNRFQREHKIPIALIKCTRGQEVLAYYEQNKDVDMFILDIVLEGKSGMEITDLLHEQGARGKIIFLTSMSKYALKGYEHGACRYWMKPLKYEKFSSDILTLYKELQETKQDYLMERVGTTVEKVYLDEIVYLMTEGRKVRVQKTTGSYVARTRMVEYEEVLDKRFYRCHTAYIVNMEHVLKIDGMEIQVSNGDTIYTSKGKKKEFMAALGDYLNEKSIKKFDMMGD